MIPLFYELDRLAENSETVKLREKSPLKTESNASNRKGLSLMVSRDSIYQNLVFREYSAYLQLLKSLNQPCS